jgi:hypothetical protein
LIGVPIGTQILIISSERLLKTIIDIPLIIFSLVAVVECKPDAQKR